MSLLNIFKARKNEVQEHRLAAHYAGTHAQLDVLEEVLDVFTATGYETPTVDYAESRMLVTVASTKKRLQVTINNAGVWDVIVSRRSINGDTRIPYDYSTPTKKFRLKEELTKMNEEF